MAAQLQRVDASGVYVGVCVGGLIFVALVIGLVVYCCCCRVRVVPAPVVYAQPQPMMDTKYPPQQLMMNPKYPPPRY